MPRAFGISHKLIGFTRLVCTPTERTRPLRTVIGTRKVVVGEEVTVLDCPGLPDPLPRVSDTYYNDTVSKLRSVGYANAILFVVNQVCIHCLPLQG